ncbi:MAG: VWA domain-containing protein, partial [candidate division WOR-3 bacterium]
MRLLQPNLLPIVGLAALPILIHILSRLQLKRAEFPTLRLLQSVRRERFSWLKLRELLLLIFRTATLAALLLAVTRPYCTPRGHGSLPAGDMIIVLDNSHSMNWGSTLERAKRAAKRLIQTLSEGRRALLLTSSDSASSVDPGLFTRSRLLLERRIDSIPGTASRTSLGPALARALKLSRQTPAVVVLITDCQERAFPEDLRIPEDTAIFLIDVGTDNARNAAVTDVRLEPAFVTPTTPARIIASFANYSGQPAVRTATLSLSDTSLSDQQTLTSPAHGRAQLMFATKIDRPGQYSGTVALSADSLALDDTFHFLFNLPEQVPVLVVQTDEFPADYIVSALGTDSLSLFSLTTVPLSQLSRQDLTRYRAIIVTDAFALSAPDWDRLEFASRSGVASLLFCSGSSLHPVRLGTITLMGSRRLTGFVTITDLDSTLPLIGWLARTDLSQARFFNYATISPGTASVLCRFSDRNPAMVVSADGRMILWAFAPLPGYTDLVHKAAFVPLLHSTLVTLTLGARRTHYLVGDTVRILANTSGQMVLNTPRGSTVITPATGVVAQFTVTSTPLTGIYRFSTAPELSFAVNPDPAEADLTRAA